MEPILSPGTSGLAALLGTPDTSPNNEGAEQGREWSCVRLGSSSSGGTDTY